MEYNERNGEAYLSTDKMREMYPDINSVQELLIRNDAGEALLRYCEAIDFNCVGKMGVKEREWFSIRLAALTVLFTQQEILDKLNEEDKQKIVNLLIANSRIIKELESKFDGLTDFVSGEVIAYIMHNIIKYRYLPNSDELVIIADDCLPDVADKHVYPIIHGPEIWEYQIPDNVLKKTSTLGLIRSFLDHPTLNGRYYTSSLAGEIARFSRIFSNDNCAQELISRNDAGDALLWYYNAVSFDCVKTQTVSEKMTFAAQLAGIAVFFTQEEIFAHLDKKKAVALLLSKNGLMWKLWLE